MSTGITAKPGSLRTLVRNLRTRDEWRRGYFCAVANLIKMDGVEPTGEALFRAGGDWRYADAEDIATLREHGLIREDAENNHQP
jgi:hypothetical protein